MRPRLSFLEKRRREQARDTVLEVLAVDGEDTGQRFTLDGPVVTIGRGRTRKGRSGDIRVADPTVSSRQAVIRLDGERAVLEQAPEAIDPTLVNGREITRKAIVPGGRIQVGNVVLEVREHKLTLEPGQSTRFTARASDPNGDSLTMEFFLDNRKEETGDAYELTATKEETVELAVKATDEHGASRSGVPTTKVAKAAPPPTPKPVAKAPPPAPSPRPYCSRGPSWSRTWISRTSILNERPVLPSCAGRRPSWDRPLETA